MQEKAKQIVVYLRSCYDGGDYRDVGGCEME